jgi:phage anti-repressor protein/uncharacterized coiled-coil protein SlyX
LATLGDWIFGKRPPAAAAQRPWVDRSDWEAEIRKEIRETGGQKPFPFVGVDMAAPGSSDKSVVAGWRAKSQKNFDEPAAESRAEAPAGRSVDAFRKVRGKTMDDLILDDDGGIGFPTVESGSLERAGEIREHDSDEEQPETMPLKKRLEQMTEIRRGARQWAKLIEEKDGKSLVNARLLHAELKVGKDFSTWIKDQIDGHKLVKGKHFGVFTEFGENPKGGRPPIEYHLAPESAKHIAAASKTEAGKDIRSYLIECERRLRKGDSPAKEPLGHWQTRPKLTHVSTRKERIAALRGTIVDLQELQKSLEEQERSLEMKQENPMLCLPGDPDADLKAAKDHIADLEGTLAELQKDRDRLDGLIVDLSSEIGKLKATIKLRDERIAELETRVEDLSDTVAAHEETIAAQDSAVAEQESLIKGLRATLKERNERIAELKELAAEEQRSTVPEGQLSKLTAEREKVAQLERDLQTTKETADKLTELVAERERLFDQQQLKLDEAAKEREILLARIEAPTRGTNLTDFFKETASFLGYTDVLGFEYLVKGAKILYQKVNEEGEVYYLPTAEFDRKGWFQVVSSIHTRREKVNGQPTGKRYEVKTWTVYLTPDQLREEDGSVYEIGGYTWLKQYMVWDELTTLQRLIVETGGPDGEFACFNNRALVKVADDSLPGLASTGEKVITIAKGQGEVVKKGEWVVGCRTESGTEQVTGLTLRDDWPTMVAGSRVPRALYD